MKNQEKENQNEKNEKQEKIINHPLSHSWCLWAHLPHDTNWTIESYKLIYTFQTVEATIALMETLPDVLVKNCMLFLMKEGIMPIWEDKQNRGGGSFSYKVANKSVYDVWKELTYCIVGNTVSENKSFMNSVTGITISPKKSFCIVKIWLSSCEYQDSTLITNELSEIKSSGCLFKKHVPES